MTNRKHLHSTNEAYTADAPRYGTESTDRSWLAGPLDDLERVTAPGAQVLDLGCGPGSETVELRERGYRVVGLDLNVAFVRLARQRHPHPGYVRGDFLHLPFHEAAFGGVWAASSLLHLARGEAAAALAEIRRVLRPGGGMYCSMQLGTIEGMTAAKVNNPIRAPRYYTFWEAADWRSALASAGFEILTYRVEEGAGIEASCNEGGRGWINAALRSP